MVLSNTNDSSYHSLPTFFDYNLCLREKERVAYITTVSICRELRHCLAIKVLLFHT